MKKTSDAVKARLNEQWKQACEGYLAELLRMWELDAYYGYWIGDEVGGVYDYADGAICIGMDDMKYCVEHDVTRKQFDEWSNYICEATEFDLPTPNLRSWMAGCPRTPHEAFVRLRQLRDDLNEAIEKEKEKIEG